MAAVAALGHTKALLIYDQNGSGDANGMYTWLQSQGINNVYLLSGGFNAWTAAGYPTESGGLRTLE